MFRIRFRGQVTAETHGDRTGGDFCENRGNNDAGAGFRERAGQAGGQGEGHRQAVGHADDDVAHDLR